VLVVFVALGSVSHLGKDRFVFRSPNRHHLQNPRGLYTFVVLDVRVFLKLTSLIEQSFIKNFLS